MDFVYRAEFFLRDGSTVLKDMEETGWLTPELLAETVRFSLVPKEGVITVRGGPFPIVVVNIPDGCVGVIKSRVYAKLAGYAQFRAFGIGYSDGEKEYMTWVLPTGDTEVGDNEFLAGLYLKSIS